MPGGPARLDEQGREYVRAVEKHFRRYLDRPINLSPKDIDAIKRWWSEQIPLAVACKGIDAFFFRHRDDPAKLARIRSLRYCEDDVRTAWEIDRQSRIGDRRGEGLDAPQRIAGKLAMLLRCLGEGALRAEEEGLVRFAEEVRTVEGRVRMMREGVLAGAAEEPPADPEGLDLELQELDRHLLHLLRESVGAGVREGLRAEAEEKLQPHREAMLPDAWERTRAILEEKMLRDRWKLPRLSLYGF